MPGHPHRYRHSVAIQQTVATDRRHFRTWQQRPDQIQRVTGTCHHQCPVQFTASYLPQQPHRLRQGELFAGQPGNEAPATNLATCFQPVIAAQQFAPGRQHIAFALQQAPANHAIAPKQGPGDVLQALAVVYSAPA